MQNGSVIYTRLSNGNQASINNFHVSIENQLVTCRNYCSNLNINIIEEVQEIKSARNMDYLYELKKIGETYSNINLVIYNFTRFSRNMMQGLQYIKAFTLKNITIHFVEENAKSNHYLDLHRIRQGLSQSEYESDTISNRVRANNLILKSKGWAFGQPPYGKEVYFEGGIRLFKTCIHENNITNFIVAAREGICTVMVLNKLLQEIIPENKQPIIFYDNHSQNEIIKFDKPYTLSFATVANLLNDYNIMNRGNIWSSQSINRIFKNNNIQNKFLTMNI